MCIMICIELEILNIVIILEFLSKKILFVQQKQEIPVC